MKKNNLQLSESDVMREMFVPKRNEMTREECRILQTSELHYVYGTGYSNQGTVRWAEHAASWTGLN
jgi:hypothetical protein